MTCTGGGLAGAQHTQTALLTHLANNCSKPTSFLRASPSPILHPHVHSHQEARMCGKKEVHVKARGGALRGCGCHQTPANATRMGCKCTSVPPVAWPAALALVLIRVLARIWKQTCPSQGSTLGSGKPHWPNQFPGTDFWAVILNLQQAHDPSTPLEEGPPPATVWGLGWAVSTSRIQASPAPGGLSLPWSLLHVCSSLHSTAHIGKSIPSC